MRTCVCVCLIVVWCQQYSRKNWLQYTTTSGTTSTGAAFTLLPLILRVWLGQIITWYQVHHGRFAQRQPQCSERHVAVQEPALVDKSQDLRLRHRFRFPVVGPVLEHCQCDVPRRVGRAEEKLFRLAADEYQSQVYLISRYVFGRHLSPACRKRLPKLVRCHVLSFTKLPRSLSLVHSATISLRFFPRNASVLVRRRRVCLSANFPQCKLQPKLCSREILIDVIPLCNNPVSRKHRGTPPGSSLHSHYLPPTCQR